VLVRNKNVSRMGVDKTRQQPIPMTTLDEMRRASTLVDEANNVVDYRPSVFTRDTYRIGRTGDDVMKFGLRMMVFATKSMSPDARSYLTTNGRFSDV
jgi:hypothetical protein